VETKEIFDAAPLSVGQFLSETGQGLYIPPYQRNYSWEVAKVRRLVDDVSHGLEQMMNMEDSICFLGTVIALRDMNYVTVEPVFRQMVPAKVMTIIDGQQRVTTLVLLTTLLHEEIRLRSARLDVGAGGAETWLLNQSRDVVGRLAMTFEEDMRYGDGDYRYYPRVIRAYYDVWSRNSGEAKYLSPIGHYLHEYAGHTRSDDSGKAYKHTPLTADQSDEPNAEAHQHLAKMRGNVRSLLRRLANNEHDEGEDTYLPGGEELAGNDKLQNGLFNSLLTSEVKEGLGEKDFQSLCRLVVLANYLLSRVTVAVVTAKREEYGFDMFEALNTTGEPLTAIETFKPRVIQTEGLVDWKASPSKISFDRVDAHLDRQGSGSTDKRQSATSALLIPFALAQDGKKLGKRLNEQRQYLRASYEEHSIPDGRREFMATLAQVVGFFDGPWTTARELCDLDNSDLGKQAALALAALRNGNHDIVIAPLSRYYGAYRLTTDERERAEKLRELLVAARACAGFYGLWRGGLGGTGGIDDVWRTAMQGEGKLRPLARKQGRLQDVPPVEDLQEYLQAKLRDKLGDRDAWIRRASVQPIAGYNALTRLLLLAASHDSVPDTSEPGLVKRGRAGIAPMLDLARWTEEANLTVEHVAPQNPAEGAAWDRAIYDTPDMVNSLGNLTLLPVKENASVGNRDWQLKRLLYRCYSSTTLDDADALLQTAASEGLEISEDSQDIVRKAQYLPLVKSLADHEAEWDADFLLKRSERLAGLAYDTLAEWIGIS
jgi:hypothetical protein